MNKKKITISLSVIAVVAAIVISGTTAFFSDTETSAGNVFQAGGLNLLIKDITHLYDGDSENAPVFTKSGFSFELDDIKPLDEGTITYKLENEENEAYLCARVKDANENPGSNDEALKSMLNFKFSDLSGTFPHEFSEWSKWVSLGTMPAATEQSYSVNYCFGIYENGECVLDDIDYNPAQKGKAVIDIEFYAVQTRNNDGFTCEGMNPPLYTILSSDDHGDASQNYADASIVDTLTLGEGDWKITGTGAANLGGDATAFNCGLRVADTGSGTDYKMLGKVNPAMGHETGRVGFGVVGSLTVENGSQDVDLVCYGGGNLPFEHNLVAISDNGIILSSGDHGTTATGYATASPIETLTLGEGSWKITGTGAVSLTGDATALNCGIRTDDNLLLSKQNSAVGSETGRVGFSVVGAITVTEDTDVHLVCYGGGALPFEQNFVAISDNGIILSSSDHGDASGSYASASAVQTLTLGEGDWKITGTGAANLGGDATAFNCGLRVVDTGSGTGYKMLGKVNPAVGNETGRVGFSVVGSLTVAAGETEDVDLVCYGGGNAPFEHNLVAIGGSANQLILFFCFQALFGAWGQELKSPKALIEKLTELI